MSEFQIHLQDSRTYYRPSESLRVLVTWSLPSGPMDAELRLFWILEFPGPREIGIVTRLEFAAASGTGELSFDLPLPDGPWSFQGLFSKLGWCVEVIAPESRICSRVRFEMAPDGCPRQLISSAYRD